MPVLPFFQYFTDQILGFFYDLILGTLGVKGLMGLKLSASKHQLLKPIHLINYNDNNSNNNNNNNNNNNVTKKVFCLL